MADKAIKVAVLEGDFASLYTLGFPLSQRSSSSKVVWGLMCSVDCFCELLLACLWFEKSSPAKEEEKEKKSKGQKHGINYDWTYL